MLSGSVGRDFKLEIDGEDLAEYKSQRIAREDEVQRRIKRTVSCLVMKKMPKGRWKNEGAFRRLQRLTFDRGKPTINHGLLRHECPTNIPETLKDVLLSLSIIYNPYRLKCCEPMAKA